MKALVITPGAGTGARLVEVEAPEPGPDEVLVAVQRVGLDGTDTELVRGDYGEAPPGESQLILGHESLGVVERVGGRVSDFEPGDLVVAMVRRPDGCTACASGEPDMCIEGNYRERGIKGIHGFLAEHFVDIPTFLVKLPPALREIGVLLEPLSVVEKGIRHAWKIQQRIKVWEPQKALVLGAGSIGQFAAMLLRLRGVETYVTARHPNPTISARMEAIGAEFIPQQDDAGNVKLHLADLPALRGPFDFVFEATGNASVAMGAMRVIGNDGIACLASVTGGESNVEICASCLNIELVLGNRCVFGTVNANRVDFESGVHDLMRVSSRWPAWLEGMITRRVPLDHFSEALEKHTGDLKVVIEIGSPAP
ncbi:MAG TPA: glucose 1-dehydrogenase [Vulgatibacter sp.]